MAGARSATTTFLLPLANVASIPRKQLVIVSSISASSPSKRTRRKNYLRPKLLKTLKKPYPNPLVPESPSISPIIPIESPLEQHPKFPSDYFSGEDPKESESHEFQLSETSTSTGVIDGSVGKFSTSSVLKLGLYLVGAFVFQTICAVWILGSANSDHKDGNWVSEDETTDIALLGIYGNNKSKSNFLLDGGDNLYSGKLGFKHAGILYVDECQLQEKIVEIRSMARNARERERLASKGNDLDDNDDVVKTGIEKEVDSRLTKLQKRLQKSCKESPVSSVSYLSKDCKVEGVVDKDGLDAKEVNGALMFKKKHKFRSPSANPSDKPKGFRGSEDLSLTKTKTSSSVPGKEMLRSASNCNNDVDLLDKDQQLDLPNGNSWGSVSMPLGEVGGKKVPVEETESMQTTRKKSGKQKRRTELGKEMGVGKTEKRIGNPRKKSPVRAVKLGESSKLEAHNFQGFTKENQDAATISNKHDVLSRNGSLKGREVGNKKSDTETDFRWMSLPYVLAILMRRGHDGEGPQGLFTLKRTSPTAGSSSHTVAFEDRGDATNFCYLLQSFFEDLGDFSADIVPLSIIELEAMKSNSMKVLVVKKGQLQLYAGQPLADVEMALSTLVGQS